MPHTSTPPRTTDATFDAIVETVADASRTLVAMTARSLAGLSEDVTLPQYRLLVVLTTRGPQRIVDLAAALAVNPSTATRMCDRLERKALVERQAVPEDRRVVQIVATRAGHRLMAKVMKRRHVEISRILSNLSDRQRTQVAVGLRLLADAAGELS
ncbi:MarR family winged helix-turn-helix transcriptional regulator [Flindersiella endophytica]